MGKHRGAKRRRKEKRSSKPVNLATLSIQDRIRHIRLNKSTPNSINSTNLTESTNSTNSITSETTNKTLALLFIIIDTLPFEEIWRSWINHYTTTTAAAAAASAAAAANNTNINTKDNNNINTDETQQDITIQILIHAKNPEKVTSPWIRSHLTNVSYKPEWGSVEITRAMVTLVEESLASCNSPSMRLCFASESCIPILPLHQTIESLWSTNTSWIDVKRKPRNGYNGSAQWVPIEKTPLIPAECVCKSDQWICLTRQHAERIASLPSSIDHTNLWEAFRKCCASDEMYFATLLSCVGIIPSRNECVESIQFNAAIKKDVSLRKMTFVEWIYPDLDDYSGNNTLAERPVTFDSLTKELLIRMRTNGCIFARKFRMECNVNHWETLVLNEMKSGDVDGIIGVPRVDTKE